MWKANRVPDVIENSAYVPIALVKAGNGNMLLSANNTYTGATNVSAGTLTLASTSSNNIANANTTAFKTSSVQFTPQFYVTDQAGTPPSATDGGSNPAQTGLGASVAGITQDFTPGTIQATGTDTDMAIDGNGFFVIKSAGTQQFTRDGAFSLDSNHQLVTGTGAFFGVLRYPVALFLSTVQMTSSKRR